MQLSNRYQYVYPWIVMEVMPQKENKNQVEWFIVDLNAQDKYFKIEQKV